MFLNVAYSPGFHTNIISAYLLEKRGIFGDAEARVVYIRKPNGSMADEKVSNFRDRSSWYTTKLIHGTVKTSGVAIMPQTQGNWVRRALDAGEVGTSSLLHTMRKSAARLVDKEEVPADQIMRGKWHLGDIVMQSPPTYIYACNCWLPKAA